MEFLDAIGWTAKANELEKVFTNQGEFAPMDQMRSLQYVFDVHND